MKKHTPYLCVEAPDTKAVLDFLHHKLGVTVDVNDNEVRIKVTQQRGEEAYVYDVLLDEVLLLNDAEEETEA
jgi:hypothetical protein